jgi:hypothetical protein
MSPMNALLRCAFEQLKGTNKMSKTKTFEIKTLDTIHEINRYLFDLELGTRISIHPISMSSFVVCYSSYSSSNDDAKQFIESNDFSMTYSFLRAISSNLYFLGKNAKEKIKDKSSILPLIQSNLQALINQKTYLIK